MTSGGRTGLRGNLKAVRGIFTAVVHYRDQYLGCLALRRQDPRAVPALAAAAVTPGAETVEVRQ
jgi:hypothetical protein